MMAKLTQKATAPAEPDPVAPPEQEAARTPRKAAAKPKTGSSNAALGFVTLDEVTDPANVLYYGREGSTKTTSAAAMANLGPTLVINAEAGLKKRPLQDRGIDVKNIRVYPRPGQALTFEGLQEVYEMIKTDLAKDPNSWAGVAFDSVTEVYQKLLEEVSESRVTKQTNLGREVDPWATELGDYGTMTKMVRHLLRRFRDLPCHFAITALERRDVDEDTGSVQYGPAITPALATDLLGYVDMVIVCKAEDEDGPVRGLTKRKGKYRAKDRFGVLPAVMPVPTIDRVIGYMEGSITEDTDPLMVQADPETGEVTD